MSSEALKGVIREELARAGMEAGKYGGREAGRQGDWEAGKGGLAPGVGEGLWPSCRCRSSPRFEASTAPRAKLVYRRTGLVQEPVPLSVFLDFPVGWAEPPRGRSVEAGSLGAGNFSCKRQSGIDLFSLKSIHSSN